MTSSSASSVSRHPAASNPSFPPATTVLSIGSSPCAGCKFLRRKCQPDCIFSPYFHADQPHKFISVHRVFGASNVAKLLAELRPDQREDAVNSLAYEAEMRLRDPVYGCVGVISLLQRDLRQLQLQLSYARAELARYHSAAAAAAAAAGSHQFVNINAGVLGAVAADHHLGFLRGQEGAQMAARLAVNAAAYEAAPVINGTVNSASVAAGLGLLGGQLMRPSAAGGDANL
ncbi:LOB domain-containing protein 6 [Apostasia shenzhenica]|uniref:LOB domain-containing protein 6 n=1 Tax=Apostasia shenzhenica TaxID=1088818 RepID=A0A2I0AUQ7_9ASPA|nr:LOB domain-containing protein 6 [Apostasia shenzhenica]